MIRCTSVTLADNSVLPVSLETIKAELRITYSLEDALLEGYIRAATAHVENEVGIVLMQRAGSAVFNGAPCAGGVLSLPVGPVKQITGVQWKTTESPDTWVNVPWTWTLLGDRNRAQVRHLTGAIGSALAVKVNFVAGLATVSNNGPVLGLPSDVAKAVALMVADFAENRQDAVRTLPTVSQILLKPYRVVNAL